MQEKPSARTLPFDDTEPLSLPMSYADDSDEVETVPMPLASSFFPLTPASLDRAPIPLELHDVLAEIRRDSRVCPQPARWLQFYRVLLCAADSTPLPPAPLTGSAWEATPALAKRMCFREQLEWADAEGCLAPAWEFLAGLGEADWHYMG